jgi:sec-independent protein translocase protein TatA
MLRDWRGSILLTGCLITGQPSLFLPGSIAMLRDCRGSILLTGCLITGGPFFFYQVQSRCFATAGGNLLKVVLFYFLTITPYLINLLLPLYLNHSKIMFNNLFLISMPGGSEWILIFLAILLLFGGKKIPELMRGIGNGIREFNNAKNAAQREIEEGMKEEKKENKKD